MKYVLVTIYRETAPNLPRMKYPDGFVKEWDVYRRGPQIRNQGLAKGLNEEEMLVMLQDESADRCDLMADCRIMTEVEADTWLGNVQRIQEMPEEIVTDSDRIQAILAKQGASIALTTEDLQALNPDHPMRGINRRLKTAASLFDGS